MQCEICKKNAATVHFKEAYDGEIREMHLCEQCARESGLDTQAPLPLTDFLFGVEVRKKGAPEEADRTCPHCGMSRSRFRKESRLGCGSCYETFKDELQQMIEELHKGRSHVGKVPRREKIANGIASMRRRMDGAIAKQDFEEAARLRDMIQHLEKDGEPTGLESRKARNDS